MPRAKSKKTDDIVVIIYRCFEMNKEVVELFPERNVTLTTYLIDDSQEYRPGLKRPVVIICPGGGYAYLSDREADPIAFRYLAAGFHAAVLRYGVNEYAVAPGPLRDIAAAVAYIKRLSNDRNIDGENIYVCGFSAGAHVAAQLGVFWNNSELLPEYKNDPELVRPAGMILGYPVLDLRSTSKHLDIGIKPGADPEEVDFAQKHPKMPLDKMFIMDEKEGRYFIDFEVAMNAYIFDGEYTDLQEDFYSLQNQVNSSTAPAFIWHNGGDGLIFPTNSLKFADAMQQAGVPYELHIYNGGGHGVALGDHLTANDENSYCPHATGWMPQSIKWINERSKFKRNIINNL